MPFYLTPKQDDFNQELQACLAEALYDVDSMWRTQGLTPKKSLRAYTVRSCRISNGVGDGWWGEDQLTATMIQISQVVARQFKIEK